MTRRRLGLLVVVLALAAAAAWWLFFAAEAERIAADPTFVEKKGELLPGFPQDFPAHPDADLEGSATDSPPNQPAGGYRAKWTSKRPVPDVMQWYAAELPKHGWTFTPPSDDSPGEQIGRVRKGPLEGYVAAEVTPSGDTEIVVDLKQR